MNRLKTVVNTTSMIDCVKPLLLKGIMDVKRKTRELAALQWRRSRPAGSSLGNCDFVFKSDTSLIQINK